MCERKSRCVRERHENYYLVCHSYRLITGDLSEIIAIDGGEGCVETEREREIRERQLRYIILVTLYTS